MNAVNVYIPEKLIHQKFGYLSGLYLKGKHSNGKVEPPLLIIDDTVVENCHEDVIGEISNCEILNSQQRLVWICIRTNPVFVHVTLDAKIICVEDLNLIFYDSIQLRKSYILSNPNLDREYFTKNMEVFIHRVKNDYTEKDFSFPYRYPFNYLLNLYYYFTFYLTFLLEEVNHFLVKRFDAKSFSVQQSVHRLKQIDFVSKNRNDKLVILRLLGVLLFDVVLGVLNVCLVNHFTSSSELLLNFESSTEVVASNVQKLLTWLSGAPAGLKLNQPLSETLASFFSYHVYLWTLYLGVAHPVLAVMANLFVYVGFLGISLQIALLADFLNLGVLHIHTFYIYAARLHMLQVSLLGSQWRGFRGRKWNPLKERVDTRSEYRQRPLIKVLSAFGFTFVLFLMPTTTVYYSVFVLLRVLLLTMKGFVSFLLWVLNSNPIFIAVLHVCGSSYLKGNPYFELLTNDNKVATNSSIQLRLTIRSSSLRDSVAATRVTVRSSSLSDSVAATRFTDVFPLMPKPKLGYLMKSLIYANELL